MKKDIELQKPVAHTSIWLGKRKKATFTLKWKVLKSQRLTLIVEISKISSTNLKKRWNIQKWSNVMNYGEAKWKAHFYNRDRQLDFVPVMYDLFELIIEASLWTMDYSTFDTHTQHTRLCSNNVYLICVIVHIQMWCVCSNTCWSNPKIFLSVLYVFESDFVLSCF